MKKSHKIDPAIKPSAVRALLTARQKEALFALRECIHKQEEAGRGYTLLPTEQDVVIRGLSLLCRKLKVTWPSDPRKSKGNPSRRPAVFRQDRMYSVRATLTDGQKDALEALRHAIQRVSEKKRGHANLPTEQETVVRALGDLAKSKKIQWIMEVVTKPSVSSDKPPTESAD